MIKVFFQKEGFSGGPKTFRDRLRPAMKYLPNISLTDDPNSKFDVELAFIRRRCDHDNPIVLRLDGCYYRKKDLSHNESSKQAIKQAKHVIFQSNFSSKMCRSIMNIEPKRWSVIYNGIDYKYINSIEPDTHHVPPGSFIACSVWKRRPNKRPLSIIKGFLEADVDRHLFIIGKVHSEWIRKYQDRRIHFWEEREPDSVIAVMKACDYQIHLCHIDSCPNAVVEGLACGLNVLCTNLGGTPEIVGNDGIVMETDSWDFTPMPITTFDGLDTLSSKDVAEGIHKLIKIRERSVRPDLDIKTVAQQYAKILEGTVDG